MGLSCDGCGEVSFEVMEEALEQSFGLLEFRGFSSLNWRELVHVGNGVKSVVVNGITTRVGTSSLIYRRGNRKIRVPIAMWPCKVEEKMTLKEVDGKTIQEFETKIIAKDGTITRVPGTFQGYETSEEESVERPRERDLGNMNGWLVEDEDEVERNEVDSDLESTASSKPVWEKTTKDDRDCASYHCPWCSNMTTKPSSLQEANKRTMPNNGNNDGGNEMKVTMDALNKTFQSAILKSRWKGGAIALTRWIKKMENVIDNSGCKSERVAAMAISWNDFKALMVEEFCPSNEMEKLENKFWNHKMVGANHAAYTDRFHELAKLVPHLVTPESSLIKRAGILTDEAVSCGTLTKGSDKRKGVEEPSKTGGSWKDNKKAKTGTGFVATTPTRNEVGN
ncbi:reverse transcriptase domain-containing protein [Tanacetum coccineum]